MCKRGGRKKNQQFCKANQLSGLDKQLSTLVFNFNKTFSISIGCGQTEVYFPAWHKAPIVSCDFMNTPKLIYVYFLLLLGCTYTSVSDNSKKEVVQLSLKATDLELLASDTCMNEICFEMNTWNWERKRRHSQRKTFKCTDCFVH